MLDDKNQNSLKHTQLEEMRYCEWSQNSEGNGEDELGTGKLFKVDKDRIKALIDANRLIKTDGIADKLNLSNSAVHNYLKDLDSPRISFIK